MNARFPDNPLLGPLSRADFITANQTLVERIVYRHFRAQCDATSTPRSDAHSEGTIGLINAYDRYSDPDVPFGAFAFPHIYGEILNSFSRRPSTGLRIPRRLYAVVKRIRNAGLAEESAEVVARDLDIPVTLANTALHCVRITEVTTLPDEEERGRSDDYSNVEVDEFLAVLKPNPRRIIRTLMAGRTRTEAAEELGISRQNIHSSVKWVQKRYEKYEEAIA